MKLLRWIYRHLLIVFLIGVGMVVAGYLYFIPVLKQEVFTFEYGTAIPSESGYYFYEIAQHDLDLSDDLSSVGDTIGRFEVTLHYGVFHYDVTIDIVDTTAPVITLNQNHVDDIDHIESIISVEEMDDYTIVLDSIIDLTHSLDYSTNGMKLKNIKLHAIDESGNQSESLNALIWIDGNNQGYIDSGYVKQGVSLEQAISAYVKDQGYSMDDLSYGYTNLTTGETLLYDASNCRVGASTYKLPLNMLIQDGINSGLLKPNDTVLFEADDYEVSAGNLVIDYDIGDDIPLDYLMHESLFYSSNTASRMLYKLFGGFSAFKQYCDRYSDVDYASTGENNWTNVNFLMDVVSYFHAHLKEYCDIAMFLSTAMPHDYGAYYLQWPMIHKYGHYDTAINDVGVVNGAYPFLFVVLSENMETQDVGMIVNIMAEYTVVSTKEMP